MDYTDPLEQVDQRWHGDFVRFVETDEASPEFEAFLNGNDELQRLVDIAQDRKASDLGDIRRAFWTDIDRIHASAADALRKSISERGLVTHVSGQRRSGTRSEMKLLLHQMGSQVVNLVSTLKRSTLLRK